MEKVTGSQAAGAAEPALENLAADVREHGQEHGQGRHAALHDFCMCIPYGALLLAGGAASLLTGGSKAGAALCLFGAVHALLAALSLRAWKRGASSAPYTLLSAGASFHLCRLLLH
jgi:hypothetical protein